MKSVQENEEMILNDKKLFKVSAFSFRGTLTNIKPLSKCKQRKLFLSTTSEQLGSDFLRFLRLVLRTCDLAILAKS